HPIAVAIADFNGDGRPDIVTANAGDFETPSDLSVLLGRGDGTFAHEARYGIGVDPRSVLVGDVNGDGRPDIVTADFGHYYISGSGHGVLANGVSLLLGHGDGTFADEVRVDVGTSQPWSPAIGDINGDGRPDLAFLEAVYVAGEGTRGAVVVLAGKGDGTF